MSFIPATLSFATNLQDKASAQRKTKAQNLRVPAMTLPQPHKPHLHHSSSTHQPLSLSSLSLSLSLQHDNGAQSHQLLPPKQTLFSISPRQERSMSDEFPAVGGDVQEEGHTPGVLRGREGVLQRGAGDDHRRDPEGVRGRRVVRQPPLLPRQPLRPSGRRRPGREVPEEVRRALPDYGDSGSQRRDCAPAQAQGCWQRQEEVDPPILGFHQVTRSFLGEKKKLGFFWVGGFV